MGYSGRRKGGKLLGFCLGSGQPETVRNGGTAEGAGFEPAMELPPYTLSRRAPSTARPPLRGRHSRRQELEIAKRPAARNAASFRGQTSGGRRTRGASAA